MIKILDENFSVLETLIHYTSFSFTHRFRDMGAFSFTLPIGAFSEAIQKNRYIEHKGKFGIIEYIKLDGSYAQISGYDLKGLLSFRTAIGGKSGKAESVIKSYITENTSGVRAFPNFAVASDLGRGGDVDIENSEGDTLINIIKEICDSGDLGISATVSDKKTVINVCVPKTVNYTFGRRYDNISEYEYTQDALNEKNCVYQKLPNSGFAMESVNSGKGVKIAAGKCYFSNGAFYDCTDGYSTSGKSGNQYFYACLSGITKSIRCFSSKQTDDAEKGNYYFYIGRFGFGEGNIADNEVESRITLVSPNTDLSGLARKEGIISLSGTEEENKTSVSEFLAENSEAEDIAATVRDFSEYNKSWHLGDYVGIKIRTGENEMYVQKIVSEVEEVYESGNMTLNVTFGDKKDGIIKKLLKGRYKK